MRFIGGKAKAGFYPSRNAGATRVFGEIQATLRKILHMERWPRSSGQSRDVVGLITARLAAPFPFQPSRFALTFF
jgi:hypothetical protein